MAIEYSDLDCVGLMLAAKGAELEAWCVVVLPADWDDDAEVP